MNPLQNSHHDDEHDDDQPVGRVLTRREMLALLGGGGAALLAGAALPGLASAQTPTATPTSAARTATAAATPSATPAPTCVVQPELTEGPYFVDGMLERTDIRVEPSDESVREGLPLRLRYRVSDVTSGRCAPIEGAQVDVWHCDALGVYSGVQDRSFDTRDQSWLRGYQRTDADGFAEFLTILPGWYSGRAVHIHFKIRTEPDADAGYEFTSQLFFDPDQIAELYALEPYADKGLPDVPNERDNIYRSSEGLLTLALEPLSDEELAALELEAGYGALFDIGLDLSDAQVGAADGFGRR